jgi:hypothetical protein
MPEKADFRQAQYRFTAHIRDPQKHPMPEGIEDRRMAIYRDLLFNNVNSFLENSFPVLRSLYRDEAWLILARKFFAQHQNRTPYFLEIPQEFLDFLQNNYQPTPEDPPYLQELAHYEWVEVALLVAEDSANNADVDPHGDLLAEAPVLSPMAWSLVYQWPVHRISTDFRPAEAPAQPTFLIVYRNSEDEVKFIEANPVTARLMQLLQEYPQHKGLELLKIIAAELNHPDRDMVMQGGHQTLLRLHKSGIVLGTRRS